MTSHSSLFLPTEIIFGPGSVKRIAPPAGKLLILTSPSCYDAIPPLEELCAHLVEHSTGTILFRPKGEPHSTSIDELLATVPWCPDTILAIGGGSTLDTAKALAMLSVSGGNCADYEFGTRTPKGAVPVLAVPTTCGSGSEVTPYAVINNSVTGRKFTLCHDCLRPRRAIIDPDLLAGLTPTALRSGGLDAFIHSLEAMLNLRSNPFTNPFAMAGLQHVWHHLPPAIQSGLTTKHASELAKGSLFGGMAISLSRTGLVHTLAVAFAEYLDTPHGVLNGWLLPEVLAFNRDVYSGRLAQIMSSLSKECEEDAFAVDKLLRWVEPFLTGQPPWASRIWTDAELEHLVDRVLQDKGLPDINPKAITRDNLAQLIQGLVTDAHR